MQFNRRFYSPQNGFLRYFLPLKNPSKNPEFLHPGIKLDSSRNQTRFTGSEWIVKNGHHLGRQRFKCKGCGFQFTRPDAKGKPPQTKCLALILYVSGFSLRSIASIVKVSPKAVLDWVRAFGTATYEKPTPTGEGVVELDEMWHFLTSKKQALGLEGVLSYYSQLVDWEGGRRDAATLSKLLKRLERLNVKVYFADHWEAYAELIPPEKLIQTKAETHGVERNNFRQRPWLRIRS